MENNVEKDFLSTSRSWSGNNHSKEKETFFELFKRKCGVKMFVGFLTIVVILIGLIAVLIMMDIEIQSLKLNNQDLMPEKQFFKNEQISVMDRLTLQNQNLIKDLAKLEDTISFLKDFINLEDQLHVASENGVTEKAKILLGLGANVNAKDGNQRTPLHKASSNGHSEIVEILLQNGAEVNALNEFDFTPLHFAAKNGHFAIVETLLKHGAEKDLKSYFNTTPLELAKYFKRGDFQQIVALLG